MGGTTRKAKGEEMIVHLDINSEEILFCDECGDTISNDAWLLIDEKNVDSIMCASCYQSLESTAKRDET